jgi:hypothetical protein
MKNKKSKNTASFISKTASALYLSLCAVALQSPAQAIEALDDAGMAAVNGQGIAILPENFKIVFNDLAYTQALSTGTPSGNVGDMYWYGMALGGDNGNVSGNSFQNARKVGSIVSWGTAANPWLIKVESPAGYLYDGTYANYPVMNYYAPLPTSINASGIQDGGLKYSFWGDIIIRDKNNPVNCTTSAAGASSCNAIAKLQSQSIWNGFSLNGSRFSIFQNTYDKSFGFSWINRINSTSLGLLRFTVAETVTPAGASAMGRSTEVPVFSSTEGMYMKDLDINMIVGVQHYQPVFLDNAANVDNPATSWDETCFVITEPVDNSQIQLSTISGRVDVTDGRIDFTKDALVSTGLGGTYQRGYISFANTITFGQGAGSSDVFRVGDINFVGGSGPTSYRLGELVIPGGELYTRIELRPR